MADIEAGSTEVPKNSITWYDMLAKVAGLPGLAYAYLFFIGFLYTATLYGRFDLDLWTLDLPTYFYPNLSVLISAGYILEISMLFLGSRILVFQRHIFIKKMASVSPF